MLLFILLNGKETVVQFTMFEHIFPYFILGAVSQEKMQFYPIVSKASQIVNFLI